MMSADAEPAGYRDIAADIRNQIEARTLAPGQRVPSAADLAQRYGVAKETGNRALGVLRREGLIVGERGKPALVRQPPEREVVKVERGSEIVFRLPTRAEARVMDCGEGQLLAVVAFGTRTDVYVCERTKFRFR